MNQKEPIKTLLEILSHGLTQHPELAPYMGTLAQSITSNNNVSTNSEWETWRNTSSPSLQFIQQALKFDNSFANERAILEQLVRDLGLYNGFVVDVAASDGYSQSCTLGLFATEGWSGLAVEMDAIKFSKLARLYSAFRNAKLARNRVTPNNAVYLLKSYEVPSDFDVLNLDIDSYDLHVINSILSNGFRPKIITMEINEKIPTGIFFTVDFDERHYWQEDHFFGCSIDAACEVVKNFGYVLWKLEYNNAFFVHKSVAGQNFKDQLPEVAYANGYKNRGDRKSLFHYNSDVDHWLGLPPEEAINQISKYFAKYAGKFTLRSSNRM